MANRRNQEEIADGYENVSPDSQTLDEFIDLESARADGSSASTTLGATAQSLSVTRPTIGRRIQTSDGKEYAIDDKESLYIRIDRRDIPEHNACLVNVLPNPALPGYGNIPPTSSKVGKFVKHPEFRSDDDRLESYSGYPLTNPSPRALANGGMFYSGIVMDNDNAVTDQVTCYKCGGTHRSKDMNDDPLTEHKKIYPQCFKEKWIVQMYSY